MPSGSAQTPLGSSALQAHSGRSQPAHSFGPTELQTLGAGPSASWDDSLRTSSSRLRSWRSRLTFLAWTALVTSGCGRPATLEDCQQIIEKVTVLELKENQIQDPTEVADYIKEAKAAFKDEAEQRCIGKRISDKALACIARATKTEEVFEDCLD